MVGVDLDELVGYLEDCPTSAVAQRDTIADLEPLGSRLGWEVDDRLLGVLAVGVLRLDPDGA